MALLDRRLFDSLRQMAFAGTAGAQKQCVFPLSDEGAGGQIEDQAAIHLRVKTEVEIIQSSLRVAEGCLFTPPLQQTMGLAVDEVAIQRKLPDERAICRKLSGGCGFRSR